MITASLDEEIPSGPMLEGVKKLLAEARADEHARATVLIEQQCSRAFFLAEQNSKNATALQKWCKRVVTLSFLGLVICLIESWELAPPWVGWVLTLPAGLFGLAMLVASRQAYRRTLDPQVRRAYTTSLNTARRLSDTDLLAFTAVWDKLARLHPGLSWAKYEFVESVEKSWGTNCIIKLVVGPVNGPDCEVLAHCQIRNDQPKSPLLVALNYDGVLPVYPLNQKEAQRSQRMIARFRRSHGL